MHGGRPILIVEEDADLCAALAGQMAADGEFAPVHAASAAQAEEKLNAADARYDGVILDMGLPDGDGRVLCSKLRKAAHRMPILMLAGSDGESDVVEGLESGANDCVTKPFRVIELLARLRAQIRLFESSEDAVLTIGTWLFRPSAKLMTSPDGGRRVRLTGKEAAILKRLHRAGPSPVARHVLLAEVWGYRADVTTHTLETHICTLRRKLRQDPGNTSMLVFGPGGYRLVQ